MVIVLSRCVSKRAAEYDVAEDAGLTEGAIYGHSGSNDNPDRVDRGAIEDHDKTVPSNRDGDKLCTEIRV
jgi:hypothetical protein